MVTGYHRVEEASLVDDGRALLLHINCDAGLQAYAISVLTLQEGQRVIAQRLQGIISFDDTLDHID